MSTKPPAGLLFILWCAVGVGPLLSYGLSTTSSLVIDELGISEAQFGLLATVTFFTASLTALWLGRLADRVSERTVLLIIFGGAAASMVVAALAHSYFLLILAMAISGGAQAMANPGTNRVIMHLDPPHKRPGWLGVKQSGVQGAQLFAGIFFPALAVFIGWQGAAAAAAVVVIGLGVLGWSRAPAESGQVRRRPARQSAAAAPPKAKPGRLPAVVWAYAAAAFATGAGIQATNVYLPLFSQRELGFSLVLAGLTAALAGVVGIGSRVFWGRAMAGNRNGFSLLLILASGAAAGALLLLLSAPAQQQWMLWAGTFLHGATALAVNVVVMAGVMAEVPRERAGAASGAVSLGMYVGFGLGPLIMGLLLESFGGFQAGWTFVLGSYLVCGLLSLTARRRRAGS
ncbi:MFS transporter [Arthrobacter monumenti]